MDNNKFLQAIECCKTADCQNCPMHIKRTGSCFAIELFELQALVGCKKEDKARYKLYYEMLKNNRARKNADIVEVVRCKGCKYFQTAKVNNKGFLICPASGMEITETDYCSYGKRKEL